MVVNQVVKDTSMTLAYPAQVEPLFCTNVGEALNINSSASNATGIQGSIHYWQK